MRRTATVTEVPPAELQCSAQGPAEEAKEVMGWER